VTITIEVVFNIHDFFMYTQVALLVYAFTYMGCP